MMKRRENKKLLKFGAGLLVIPFIFSLPLNAMAAETYYVNAKSGLNIREVPSIDDNEPITAVTYGTELHVIEWNDGEEWALIEYEDGTAYVYSDYIQENKPEPIKKRTESNNSNMTYLGTFSITAYEATGNPCANGKYPTVGYTVACNSLPLGTVVYIEGVGYRTVEDRGASWHSNNWMDLYLGDVTACNNWGIRKKDVYVVK